MKNLGSPKRQCQRTLTGALYEFFHFSFFWSFPSVEGPHSDTLSRTRFSIFLRISFGVSSSSSMRYRANRDLPAGSELTHSLHGELCSQPRRISSLTRFFTGMPCILYFGSPAVYSSCVYSTYHHLDPLDGMALGSFPRLDFGFI